MSEIRIIDRFHSEVSNADALLRRFYQQFHRDKQQQVTNLDALFTINDDIDMATVRRSGKLIWFLAHHDTVVGFVTFDGVMPPYNNCATIYDFFIDKPYRRLGFGRIALNIITARLFTLYPKVERIGLGVFSGNIPAKQLYRSVGFTNAFEVMLLERPQG
jgi:ribosomal protein S18 acetylase RimI-like enzyme